MGCSFPLRPPRTIYYRVGLTEVGNNLASIGARTITSSRPSQPTARHQQNVTTGRKRRDDDLVAFTPPSFSASCPNTRHRKIGAPLRTRDPPNGLWTRQDIRRSLPFRKLHVHCWLRLHASRRQASSRPDARVPGDVASAPQSE